MDKSETIWQPSDHIKGMMYKDQITLNELKNAILDCWFWMFGSDPIYCQMLYEQFKKEVGDWNGAHKDNLIRVINKIEYIAGDFRDKESSRRSLLKLRALATRCCEPENMNKDIGAN